MRDFRNIGIGTDFEFKSYILDKQLGKNIEWYDKSGNKYSLVNGYLVITSSDGFNNNDYSIADYINDIPSDSNLIVILNIISEQNVIELFNTLFDILSTKDINRKVIINITNLKFNEKTKLVFDNLDNNVKISSMLDDNLKENNLLSNESFESWMLNCDEERFKMLLQKLSANTLARIKRMREIASNFYRRTPLPIKKASNLEKTVFAFKWCIANINYDFSAVNSDGSLKIDKEDSKNPIYTLEHKKGVSEGRAKLLKLFLNNFYMQVPCFLVRGTVNDKQHIWNEVLMEDDTTVEFDLSNQINKVSNSHLELEMYTQKENGKVKKL